MDNLNIPTFNDFKNVQYTETDLVTAIRHSAFMQEDVRNFALNLMSTSKSNYNSEGLSVYAVLKSIDLNYKLMNYFMNYILDILRHQNQDFSDKFQNLLLQPYLLFEENEKSEVFKSYDLSEIEQDYLSEQESFDLLLGSTVLSPGYKPDVSKYPKLRYNNICLLTLTIEQFYQRLCKIKSNLKKLWDPKKGDKISVFVKLAYDQNIAKNFGKFIYLALKPNKHDLLYQSYDHDFNDLKTSSNMEHEQSESFIPDSWQTLAGYIELIDWGKENSIDKQYYNLISFMISMGYKDCPEQVKQFAMNSGVKQIRRTLGAGDKFEDIIERTTPKIHTNHIIYIPKIINNFETVMEGNFDLQETKTGLFIHSDKTIYDDSTHVQVRVLWNGIQLSLEKPSKEVTEIDYAVIHIHGGGFVTCSSLTHSGHTKYWARDCKMPIFSIDYRLAPEHPYPWGIEDCFNVYYWLITEGFDMFGIKPEKVYIVGDSAGGNLSTCVTTLSIQNSIPTPDMWILIYPTLKMSADSFTPSLFYAMDDPILNINFLKIWVDSYLMGDIQNDNILTSPLMMSDDMLKQYPSVRIMVSTYIKFDKQLIIIGSYKRCTQRWRISIFTKMH